MLTLPVSYDLATVAAASAFAPAEAAVGLGYSKAATVRPSPPALMRVVKKPAVIPPRWATAGAGPPNSKVSALVFCIGTPPSPSTVVKDGSINAGSSSLSAIRMPSRTCATDSVDGWAGIGTGAVGYAVDPLDPEPDDADDAAVADDGPDEEDGTGDSDPVGPVAGTGTLGSVAGTLGSVAGTLGSVAGSALDPATGAAAVATVVACGAAVPPTVVAHPLRTSASRANTTFGVRLDVISDPPSVRCGPALTVPGANRFQSDRTFRHLTGGPGRTGAGHQLIVRRIVDRHEGQAQGRRDVHARCPGRGRELLGRTRQGNLVLADRDQRSDQGPTIEWQNASAVTSMITCSSCWVTVSDCNSRTVVAPSRGLQNDAKSWSPISRSAALDIDSMSSGRRRAKTSLRPNGSTPHSALPMRYR